VSSDELRIVENIDEYRDWLIALVEECEVVKDIMYDDAIPAFQTMVAKQAEFEYMIGRLEELEMKNEDLRD
jgi:hypothetical protein